MAHHEAGSTRAVAHGSIQQAVLHILIDQESKHGVKRQAEILHWREAAPHSAAQPAPTFDWA